MDWLSENKAPVAVKKVVRGYGSSKHTALPPGGTFLAPVVLPPLPTTIASRAPLATLEEDDACTTTSSHHSGTVSELLSTADGFDFTALMSRALEGISLGTTTNGRAAQRKRPLLKARVALALGVAAPAPEKANSNHGKVVPKATTSVEESSEEEKEEEEEACGGKEERRRTLAMKSAYRRVTMAPAAFRKTLLPAPEEEKEKEEEEEKDSLAPPLPSPSPPLITPTATSRALSTLLPTILECLPSRALLLTAPCVSKAWRDSAYFAYSWRVAVGVGNGGAPESLREEKEVEAAPPTIKRVGERGRGGGKGAPPPPPPPSPLPLPPPSPPIHTSWTPFLHAFPWGVFLASGAYKRVYKVWVAARGRWEAVGVMNCDTLAAIGALDVVSTEIQVGCLLTQALLHSGVSPHYVETFSVFCHAATPEEDFPGVWERDGATPPPFSPLCPSVQAAERVVATPSSSSPLTRQQAHAILDDPALHTPLSKKQALKLRAGGRRFQYTRMELCDKGDLEGYLRDFEPKMCAFERWGGEGEGGGGGSSLLAAVDASCATFASLTLLQMCFSLLAARERVSLKHYDVKLLNWFVCSPPPQGLTLRYNVSGTLLEAPLAATTTLGSMGGGALPHTALLCKLADYGTACLSPTPSPNLKKSHWTTIENAPPEFFLLGDTASPSFAVDTWALGLCALHLLTGGGPYEEQLEGCVAPKGVRGALLQSWANPSLPFTIIRKLLAMDDSIGEVLVDTLWKYTVLSSGAGLSSFSITTTTTTTTSSSHPMPQAILLAAISPTSRGGDRKVYQDHVARFSWASGTHASLVRARRRLAHLPPAFASLCAPGAKGGLLDWDPVQRPAMRDALIGGAFKSCAPQEGGGGGGVEGGGNTPTILLLDAFAGK